MEDLDRDPDYDNDDDKISENEETSESEEEETEKITLKARKLRRTNGKWKLYYDKRVFRKEWEEAFPWVEQDPDNPQFAICRACNKRIKAHKGILETHQKTKRHLKNLSGSDDLDDTPERGDKVSSGNIHHPSNPHMEQMVTDDQINFFAESAVDAAHQAITSMIDKLVEKYHQRKLENLQIEHEAALQLHKNRLDLLQMERQRKKDLREQQEANVREAREAQLKYLQLQHETKISAMEDERDAKLRAVEQELMYARQEYEKKMRLLDVQLSCMK